MTQACEQYSEKTSLSNALEIQSFTKPLICDNDDGSQGINKNNMIFVQNILVSAYRKFSMKPVINSSDAGNRIFWTWGVNTMPADALAPEVARASADIVLAA